MIGTPAQHPGDGRYRLRISGVVQGVGFRPFVYRLASDLALRGWVCNDDKGVQIEVQGYSTQVETFLTRLTREVPRLAQIDGIECVSLPLRANPPEFVIKSSHKGEELRIGVTPDAAVCPDCLAELFDPRDRRYRYPFINCTQCGPRYTLTEALPYDRPNTTMVRFTQCPQCLQEYTHPRDRRFHAQPNACAVCGPRLSLLDGNGVASAAEDPVASAMGLLEDGAIIAIKGLGGFHLACDARNSETVARLRLRKDREEKPLAVMVAGVASALPWVYLEGEAAVWLRSGERPIVLLPKRPRCAQALTDIAPGIAWLGVMLPYTPLHYLLFHEAAGRPQGTDWLAEAQPLMLVMTSANPRGEPLVADNAVALQRLHGIADAFLMHDRDIAVRCDDSVVRAQQHGFSMIRRARGYTPRAILLPRPGPPVLACGGWYKNTVCLTRNDQAFLSQHIGDLDHAATCEVLAQTVRHLAEVLEIKPQRVAHDLHPDFFSTQFAQGYAAAHGIAAIPVQHHHAHIAGVIAEHRLQGPVLGLALDGIGLGTDNGLWGGELLRVEDHRFTRLGHLAALPLPGAERAAREPWRCAAGALHALGRQEEITRRFPSAAAAAVAEMLAKGIHTPGTSSAGRLFDAAAGLLGVQPRMSFEGQAAMRLEGLAAAYGPVPPDVGGYRLEDEGILNMLPLLGRLCEDIPADYGAALFHATLIAALAAWLQRAAAGHGLRRIVLSGGCFQNHLLSTGLRTRLAHMQLEVFAAARAPANDGGLSLGQAWVAMTAHEPEAIDY